MNREKVRKICIILLLVCLVVFVLVYVYKKKYMTSNDEDIAKETASEIANQYDNTTYGEAISFSGMTITTGGNYDLSGKYSCITVNTSEKVQLNLTDVTITCNNGPAINVIDSEYVSIVLNGKNTIKATTTSEMDAAIYSKSDLVLSGNGSLDVDSNYDGIVSVDTLIIKSGVYTIKTDDDGIRGKDKVAIVNGTFSIVASGDGIKATNEEDSLLGYIAIDNGTFSINSVNDGIEAYTNLVINDGTFSIATSGEDGNGSSKGLKAGNLLEINGGVYALKVTDDGIHADGDVTIKDGKITIDSGDDGIHADGMVLITGETFDITAHEGIEATYVKINDGVINISASDDGINAGNKSKKYSVTVEINGGTINIEMGSGDTDGIDANGNLYINGGVINITANSPFDYDGEAKYTGGTIIVNGEKTSTITNQTFGGAMGPGGNRRRY